MYKSRNNHFSQLPRKGNLRKEEMEMKLIRSLFVEEDGIGTVELILILVVLIGIVIIFKKQLTTLVENIFKTITQRSGTI